MTNREYIRDKRRMSKAVACWLQPHFHLFDVTEIPILVTSDTKAYGQTWIVFSDGQSITVSTNYFIRCNSGPLIQHLAHELTHVEQFRKGGVLRWCFRTWQATKYKVWGTYSHASSSDEKEAEDRRHEVYLGMLGHERNWGNLLDEEA